MGRYCQPAAVSGGQCTEGADLLSKIDVQAHNEELTCTHQAIVRDKSNKVNLITRKYPRSARHAQV